MSRGALKVLAILLMAGNHIAQVFLNRDTVPYHLLLTLGYATAPLMCAFLSDGFIYTHDRKAYGIRLLIFALVSELPFCLAFGRTGNMGWTLPVLEHAIAALEAMPDKGQKPEKVTYWTPTRENAIHPLYQLLAMARMRPDGVWDGD